MATITTKPACELCGAVSGIPHHQPLSTLNNTEPTARDLRIVRLRLFEGKRQCQLCLEGRREMLRDRSRALYRAARAQTAFWDALSELEDEFGIEIDGNRDLTECTVESLEDEKAEADEDEACTDVRCTLPAGHTGPCEDEDEDEDEDEEPGPCVDCGTQCVSGGEGSVVCPVCDKTEDEEPGMSNENGYVIYPISIGKMDFDEACEYAQKASAEDPGTAYRVDDCDTEATVAKFLNGIRESQ